MAVTVFKDANYTVSGLLSRIKHGEIALPDIQRPFVWSNSKVRDLFDSMYKGFPVGYILLWSTDADTDSRKIGLDNKQTTPSLLIVDGQQRLTSLFAVINAKAIVSKDYSERLIRIAFRPRDMLFEVTDAAIEKDPEFIADISLVFAGGFHTFTNEFLNKLEAYRNVELSNEEKDRLVENIDRLKDLQNYPFQAIELERTVDEEHVADVFVRINSKGILLNAADFILTLMSVHWDEGRHELEKFSRSAKTLNTAGKPSPFNHFIDPEPDQLLRSSIGLAFQRARLQYVYSVLRGKNLDTGQFSKEYRDVQFEKLKIAQNAVLNLTNWHEFLKCLSQAGFRSKRMITSETTVMYVYTLWLIGRINYKVDYKNLRRVISRWWFMSQTTGRYTSSPETQLESDLNLIRNIPESAPEKFCETLDHVVRDTFTRDYWDITLPNRLNSSSAKSPTLVAYWASLITLEADALFSDQKVSVLLDPVVTKTKNVERHHLFPKAYLSSININDPKRVNSIANMAFVDWTENSTISNKSPLEYWPKMISGMNSEQLKRQIEWHALPVGWEQLDFLEFCEKRRKLIARVIEKGFKKLLIDHSNVASFEPLSIKKLITNGESNNLEFKELARWSHGTEHKGKSEHIIVKSVAGFMNSEGGTLVIGVNDNGSVTGLDRDYETISKGNRDGYELFLRQLLKNNIDGTLPNLYRISFEEIEGKDVCRIDVFASSKPVFTCPMKSKNPTDFWVRQGNKTEQLHGRERNDYTNSHWG